jgi:hypothetical protein
MKSKKLVYGLLILVLLIWGIIAYRIVSALKKDKPAVMPANKAHALIKSDTETKDFEIVANYRDPFLGQLVKKETGKVISTVKPAPKKIPVSTLVWPQIKFGGIIRNQQSKQPLALVTINGKEKIMKEKETVFEITLSKIYRDSAEFDYQKEKKIIRK